jgi:hypothetical protein
MRWLAAGFVSLLFAGSAQALEVWLASSESCNSCAIFERVAQQRGYGSALRYADGSGSNRIPILSIFKSALAEDVLAQLPPDVGPASPGWDVTLTVLVVDAGHVLTAGNIADSADNAQLVQPRAVMFPPAQPDAGDPSVGGQSIYNEFFLENWNLEYFVDVALGKRPKRAPVRLVDLASPAPAMLGPRNVVLWGSAGTPLANALFIPTRMAEIRAALDAQKLGLHYVTLFGHGPGVQANDTSYSVDGRTQFKRSDNVHADYAADAKGLNSVLTGVLRAERARTLLVQVGHSGPAGAPLWGQGLTLLPADLEPLKGAAGRVVMVSGACNGGMFAKVAQCGFFAAHPDVKASGCQLSPAALEASDDYLRLFFRGATGAAAANNAQPRPLFGGARNRASDAPTLYDAHWFASTRLEDHQLSYTTTDALIDDYFAANPDKLPATMTVGQIRAAVGTLPRAEVSAVLALTAGLADDRAIPLTGYVEANRAADAKLADAREKSSAERNQIIALPYKLELSLLARRIAYGALHVNDAQYAVAAKCEQQSLATFFGGR